MADKIPPIPTPPPPKTSAAKGERGIFNAYINAHKALKPYAGQIWTWANNYGGITPTQLAAVLLFESGGKSDAKSSKGALGLAQIFDTKANPKNAAGVPFFRGNLNISDADKKNPAFAIQYAAWRLSGATQKYGSVDAAYLQDYNPGYTASATPISSLLPKGYVGTPQQTATQSATSSVATSAATASIKAQTFDKWAVLDAKGHITYTTISDLAKPPKNVLTYAGLPQTKSSFTQIWGAPGGYGDTFASYAGRRPTGKEVAAILRGDYGISVYAVANTLAQSKDFPNSPAYKMHAPGLISYARTILGENWKPSGGIIRQAIAQNWDQATFYAHLKQTPAYLKGPEYQDNAAKMQATYEGIYGKADQGAQTLIHETTLQGWTPDEFSSWLRSQDAYKHTPEYQSKVLSFMGSNGLGLITGAVPTASPAPQPGTPQFAKPVGPNSTRIPGQGSLGTGTGLQINGVPQTFPGRTL